MRNTQFTEHEKIHLFTLPKSSVNSIKYCINMYCGI